MPVMLLCLSSNIYVEESEVKLKAFKYDFCGTCINQEVDQSQCYSCDEGSNYEDMDEDNIENLTYHEFIEFIKEAA